MTRASVTPSAKHVQVHFAFASAYCTRCSALTLPVELPGSQKLGMLNSSLRASEATAWMVAGSWHLAPPRRACALFALDSIKKVSGETGCSKRTRMVGMLVLGAGSSTVFSIYWPLYVVAQAVVQQYLADLREGSARSYLVQFVLVGDQRAGKSSLVDSFGMNGRRVCGARGPRRVEGPEGGRPRQEGRRECKGGDRSGRDGAGVAAAERGRR